MIFYIKESASKTNLYAFPYKIAFTEARLLTALGERRQETIPLTIKSMRKILAMDQETFSKFVDVSVATLRKIEQENGNANLILIKKLRDKFSLELVVKTKKKQRSVT